MKLVLSSILILFFINAFAQPYPVQHDSTHVFYAEAGIGAAIPYGTFKYIHGGENNGYAFNGVSFILSAKTYKNKFFGLKYGAVGMINPVDDSFHTRLNVSYDITKKMGKWINVLYGFGPVFYASNESVLFEFNILAGFISSTRPKVVYRYFDLSGLLTNEYSLTGGYGLGLGFMPELSMSFKLDEKISLKIFANYVFAKAKVNYKIFGGTYDNYTGLDFLGSYVQPLLLQSLNGGVSMVILLE